MNNAFTLNLPAKATAFHLGDLCSNYLLILSGRINVLTRAENGREVRFTTWPAFLTRITGAGAGRSPPGEKCGLESRSWLKLSRGRVEIPDKQSLEEVASV